MAIGVAVGLHGLLLLAFMAAGSGTLLRGAQARLGDGDAVEVMISGREGSTARTHRTTPSTDPAEVQLQQLVERLRSVNAPLYIVRENRPTGGGSLADLFDAPAGAAGPGRNGDGLDAAGNSADKGRQARTAFASTVGDGASGDSSAGGLWRAVEPCWTRLPLRSAVPVILEVSLNGEGRLAKPPRIVRPTTGRPDEVRLVAEARALQAIAACLPYGDRQAYGSTQTVAFPGQGTR